MSLVPSVNGGTADFPYFHINRGAQADINFSLPVIVGSAIGTVRLGDASGGMILRGDPLTGNGSIRGGESAGTSLTLGSSNTAPAQVVITDAAVTSIAPLIVSGGPLTVTGNIQTTGNLILGGNGGSTSGYSQFITPAATYNDGTDTALATPVGMTTGWWVLSEASPAGGQNEQQVSTIVHYTSTTGLFDVGGSIRSVAGTGAFGFKPSIDRTQMQVHNSTGFNQANISVYWVKLLN